MLSLGYQPTLKIHHPPLQFAPRAQILTCRLQAILCTLLLPRQRALSSHVNPSPVNPRLTSSSSGSFLSPSICRTRPLGALGDSCSSRGPCFVYAPGNSYSQASPTPSRSHVLTRTSRAAWVNNRHPDLVALSSLDRAQLQITSSTQRPVC